MMSRVLLWLKIQVHLCYYGEQNNEKNYNISCTFSSTMQEESDINLSKKDSKITQKDPKSFSFSPLDELGIQYDQKNEADVSELNKLVGQIINYPSTELAQIHSQALRLGNYDIQDKSKPGSSNKIGSEIKQVTTKCPCCGFTRQIDNIKICTSLDEIKNIGTSTYLYFNSFKHLSTLLAIMGLIYSIFAIATNIIAYGNKTSTTTGVVDYIKLSLSAKQLDSSLNPSQDAKNYYYIQCWIGAAVCLIWAFVFAALKYFEMKGAIEYDEDTSSISDFSVVIEGMPLDVTVEQLQAQLNSYYTSVTQHRRIPQGRKRPFKIIRLNKGIPFYLNQEEIDSDDLKPVEKQLAQLKDTFKQWLSERQSKPTFSETKEKREEKYKRYVELLNKRVQIVTQMQKTIKKQLKEKKSTELTTVFVTFQTNIAAQLMVELNETTIFSRIKGICGDVNKFVLHRGENLYTFEIRRAPQPEDIIWTNIGLNDCSFYGRKVFTYIVTFVLLGACFGIVYSLSKQQQRISKDAVTDSTSRYLSIGISLVIAIVNPILSQVIGFLTNFQRNYTITNKQTSLAIKSIFAQMINSILIPVIIAKYIRNQIYSSSGLVDNIFMMSITNAVVGPTLVFFDPVNLLSKFIRCFKSRSGSKLSQNQRDHNNLYLGPEFQVGSQYIYTVNLFMFCCYFVSLQPINVFFALIGYLLMYWIQKYCMFYRYRRPVPGSEFVNKACYQIIMFGPLLYSLGSMTWSNFLPDGVPSSSLLPNLVALGISILIIMLPFDTIVMGCCFSDKIIKVAKYEDQRISFASEYDRMNPSTQEEAVAQYAKFCENFSKNISKLSAEKQEEIKKKLEQNAQRAQLQQYQQQNSVPLAFGMQSSQSAYSNIMNPYSNPYMPPMYAPQPAPVQIVPQPSYNPNINTQARIIQNQPIQYSNIQMTVPQPQPFANPMNMGGMGFNPMMGMQAQQSFNPFNPFNGGFNSGFNSGFRMW